MSLSRADIGTWLINLPRSTERRETMEARLAQIGLPYTLFEAVDGKARQTELAPLVDIPRFERNLGRRLMWGDIGCYASHLEVWKALIASDKLAALVLEDDVVFHDDFLEAIDLALAHPGAWDMLKLNKIRAKHPVSQGFLGRWRLNAYIGPATGTGAYLITREAAARLLPQFLPITRTVDHELDRPFVHDFRMFGLEPFPSHVDDGGQSSITGSGFSNVQKFPKWQRLPNYLLRFGNLLRKLLWLGRKGYLFGRGQRDLTKG